MTYLVDADVLSEPTRPDPDQRATVWLRRHEREIAVDPVILGGIRFGIRRLPPGARRERLERWSDSGVRRLQCLPWEAETGRWRAGGGSGPLAGRRRDQVADSGTRPGEGLAEGRQ